MIERCRPTMFGAGIKTFVLARAIVTARDDSEPSFVRSDGYVYATFEDGRRVASRTRANDFFGDALGSIER